ncbi:cyclic nucleotide-binding domain-containing protein [Acidihalobacter yilgarnensis]|nr:cyclic nucleotide-binding domain-containing protein [Acidihalobacter yilgarnensis]
MVPENMHLLEFIKDSPLSQDLTATDCEVLENIMGLRHLDAGEVVIREGETDQTVYLVAQGRVRVVQEAAVGEPLLLHVLGPGGLCGEMGFVDGAPHSATLIAEHDSVLLSLERASFESLIETHPHVVYHVMRAIIRLGHAVLKRMNQHHLEMNNYITQTRGRY